MSAANHPIQNAQDGEPYHGMQRLEQITQAPSSVRGQAVQPPQT
jgi:hypothetical protein